MKFNFDDLLPKPLKLPDFSSLRVAPSAEQTEKIVDATEGMHAFLEVLAASSNNLEALTGVLIKETEKVHTETAILASSSGKLESLTISLKRLTIWLIVFAGIQIVIAAVQTWKMFRDIPAPQTAPVSTTLEPKR
jgi:hypothetical protein